MKGVRGQAIIGPQAPWPQVTYEQYLDWLDEDTWAEWEEGMIRILSPASYRHQQLATFLLRLLAAWAEETGAGIVIPAPFVMHLPAVPSAREPDLLFVARDHLDRLRDNTLEGPADLVVEIVSPESRVRDRGTKRAEYELGGVPEYWVIDPDERRAEFYRRCASARFVEQLPDSEGVYRTPLLPGLALRLDWLWSCPPLAPIWREVRR